MTPADGVKSLLLLRNNCYETHDAWLESMVDALILNEIEKAATMNQNPKEFIGHLLMMIQERSIEWLPN